MTFASHKRGIVMLDPTEIHDLVRQHAQDGTLFSSGIREAGQKIFDAYSEMMPKETLNQELNNLIKDDYNQLKTMGGNTFGVIQMGDQIASKMERFVEEKNEEFGHKASPS